MKLRAALRSLQFYYVIPPLWCHGCHCRRLLLLCSLWLEMREHELALWGRSCTGLDRLIGLQATEHVVAVEHRMGGLTSTSSIQQLVCSYIHKTCGTSYVRLIILLLLLQLPEKVESAAW